MYIIKHRTASSIALVSYSHITIHQTTFFLKLMSKQLRRRLVSKQESSDEESQHPDKQTKTTPQQPTGTSSNIVLRTTNKLEINKMNTLNINTILKIISDFDGIPSLLHKFINCCEKILSSKLSGKAYELIKYNTYNSFKDLRVDLQTQFLETKSLEQIQNDLVNIRQGPSEDEQTYALRVEKLLIDLNSAC